MYVVDYNNRIVNIQLYEWLYPSVQSDQIDTSVSTILWSKLPFYSNILGNLMYREEAVLWEKLFLQRSSDFLRPVNFYNNICNGNYHLCHEMIQESKHESSVKDVITDILHHKPNYLEFLFIYHRMAHEEDIYYEMFQKSFFYEMFFHLLKKETIITKPIMLAICKNFMGLDVHESFIDEVLEFYSHKYAYQIIPRRHGKTFMTGSGFVSLLFTCLTSGLKLGYYSHTKDLSQTVKNFVIGKCKEWSEKLCQYRYNIMTPTDSVVVKIVNDMKTTIFSNDDVIKDDDFNCLAKFKSARNDNALRGDDLNILIVDEAFSINKSRFATILAHGQKADNKIIFLTSPVNHKVDEMCEITRSLKCRKDINLYHVYYFCNNPDHLQYAAKHPACPNLIFYKPNHIHINETNRYLSNLLAQSNTSYEDELGIVPMTYSLNRAGSARLCPFSERFLTYLKYNVNIINDSNSVENVFIYLDPNYCDSLTSGIGLVATGLTREQTPCVLYLDHKFIESEELGKANEIMVKMILRCINHVAKTVSSKRTRDGECKFVSRSFFVAVENNSQRNNCVSIYEKIKDCFKNSEIKVYLYYTPAENRLTKELHKRAGYTLLNKFTIFSQTIQMINEKLIWFSNLLHSFHLNEGDKNEIEYLRYNIEQFKFYPDEKKFTGKSHNSTDDLVVALIMSIYLAKTFTTAFENSSWLSLSCWACVSRK